MQETKKGGPYNKTDQDSRRNEVGRLYFEYGYSAREIAEMMKVNRNTINADIKYLYSNIKEEIKENSGDFVLRQIGRLEAQRSRIANSLRDEIDEKIKYEKLLLEIDSKINNLLSRINSQSTAELKDEKIKEEKIKDFVLFLLIKYSKEPSLEKENIISEIISVHHCTMSDAKHIFLHIEELGLECCKKFRDSIFVYDMLEFAYLRRYLVPTDPFVTKIQELCLLENHAYAEKIRQKRRFKEKHGSEEKWSDRIFEQFDEEKRQIAEKFTKSSSKIIAEALGELADQEEVDRYLNCINVFFGKEEKSMLERIGG